MKGQKRKTWIPADNREDDRRGSREEDTESSFRQRMSEHLHLYVFSHSLTLPNVSLCHSRFSLSVIPDNKTWIPANYCGEESRVLCQTDPHA